MGFKTVNSYNEERFGGMFLLRNDQDSADVIFLYRNTDDVLVADTHYIKSADYSGYVHCCGAGCPACAKQIRVQTKLFIPVFNITKGEIEFWDRTMHFEPQLMQDVFKNYPNPSDFVFTITRKGAAGDVNTVYEIRAVGKNTAFPFESILANAGVSMPDHYNTVCKEVTISELATMLASSGNPAAAHGAMPSYQVTPRGVAAANSDSVPESAGIELPPVDFGGSIPADAPMVGEDDGDVDVNF